MPSFFPWNIFFFAAEILHFNHEKRRSFSLGFSFFSFSRFEGETFSEREKERKEGERNHPKEKVIGNSVKISMLIYSYPVLFFGSERLRRIEREREGDNESKKR